MEPLRLFWLFVKTSVLNDTEYRADFFGQLLVTLLGIGTQLAAVWVIFSHTPNLAGWSLPEVLALLGVYNFMSGFIGALIAPNMRRLLEDVQQGTLDFALLKPVESQFLVSVRQFVIWRLTDIVLGIALAVYATLRMTHQISLYEALLFPVMLLCGTVIVYAFWLILITTSFWFIRLENIEMIWWNLFEAGRYPINVYPVPIRNFLTFVVPIAFVTTIPARALGRGLDGHTVLLAVLLAVAMALVSAWFWRVGLRRYGSASS
jgi:viologen exporter family transport system permease protein